MKIRLKFRELLSPVFARFGLWDGGAIALATPMAESSLLFIADRSVAQLGSVGPAPPCCREKHGRRCRHAAGKQRESLETPNRFRRWKAFVPTAGDVGHELARHGGERKHRNGRTDPPRNAREQPSVLTWKQMALLLLISALSPETSADAHDW